MKKKNSWLSLGISPFTVLLIVLVFVVLEFIITFFSYSNIISAFYIEGSSELIRMTFLIIGFGVVKIGHILFSPILGSFADWFGRRKTLLISISIWIFSFFMGAFGINFFIIGLYLLSRFLSGGSEVFYPLAVASICDFSKSEKNRLNYIGIISILPGLKNALLLLICSDLLQTNMNFNPSLPFTFLFVAIYSIFIFLLVLTNFSETLPISHSWNSSLFSSLKNYWNLFSFPKIKTVYTLYFLSFFFIQTASQFSIRNIIESIQSKMNYDQYISNNNGVIFLFIIYGLAWTFSSSFLLRTFLEKLTEFKILSLIWFVTGLTLLINQMVQTEISNLFSLIIFALSLGIVVPMVHYMISNISSAPYLGRSLIFLNGIYGAAVLLGQIGLGYYLYSYSNTILPSIGILTLLGAFVIFKIPAIKNRTT